MRHADTRDRSDQYEVRRLHSATLSKCSAATPSKRAVAQRRVVQSPVASLLRGAGTGAAPSVQKAAASDARTTETDNMVTDLWNSSRMLARKRDVWQRWTQAYNRSRCHAAGRGLEAQRCEQLVRQVCSCRSSMAHALSLTPHPKRLAMALTFWKQRAVEKASTRGFQLGRLWGRWQDALAKAVKRSGRKPGEARKEVHTPQRFSVPLFREPLPPSPNLSQVSAVAPLPARTPSQAALQHFCEPPYLASEPATPVHHPYDIPSAVATRAPPAGTNISGFPTPLTARVYSSCSSGVRASYSFLAELRRKEQYHTYSKRAQSSSGCAGTNSLACLPHPLTPSVDAHAEAQEETFVVQTPFLGIHGAVQIVPPQTESLSINSPSAPVRHKPESRRVSPNPMAPVAEASPPPRVEPWYHKAAAPGPAAASSVSSSSGEEYRMSPYPARDVEALVDKVEEYVSTISDLQKEIAVVRESYQRAKKRSQELEQLLVAQQGNRPAHPPLSDEVQKYKREVQYLRSTVEALKNQRRALREAKAAGMHCTVR